MGIDLDAAASFVPTHARILERRRLHPPAFARQRWLAAVTSLYLEVIEQWRGYATVAAVAVLRNAAL